MFTPQIVVEVANSLKESGRAVVTDARGKKLALVSGKLLGLDKACLLIAYEGCGSYFYDFDRPLNAYRLISAGFSMTSATVVSDLVNKVTTSFRTPVIQSELKQSKDLLDSKEQEKNGSHPNAHRRAKRKSTNSS